MIDWKKKFYHLVKSNMRTYDNIQKITTGQGNWLHN